MTLSKLDELEKNMLLARGGADPSAASGATRRKAMKGRRTQKAKGKTSAMKVTPSAASAKKVKRSAAAMKTKGSAMKARKAPVSLESILKEYMRAGKTRGAFTTKAYYDATMASLNGGSSKTEANKKAKIAHARAADLWDRRH